MHTTLNDSDRSFLKAMGTILVGLFSSLIGYLNLYSLIW